MYSVLNTLSEYTNFYISKNITSYTFLLVFKIVESLQCILKLTKIEGVHRKKQPPEVGALYKKVFLKIPQYSQESNCFRVSFSKFIKKILQHRCFPCEYCETFKNTILKNICKRLLLSVSLDFSASWYSVAC